MPCIGMAGQLAEYLVVHENDPGFWQSLANETVKTIKLLVFNLSQRIGELYPEAFGIVVHALHWSDVVAGANQTVECIVAVAQHIGDRLVAVQGLFGQAVVRELASIGTACIQQDCCCKPYEARDCHMINFNRLLY